MNQDAHPRGPVIQTKIAGEKEVVRGPDREASGLIHPTLDLREPEVTEGFGLKGHITMSQSESLTGALHTEKGEGLVPGLTAGSVTVLTLKTRSGGTELELVSPADHPPTLAHREMPSHLLIQNLRNL